MLSSKVLEMLDAGKIDELRKMLQDEIYIESLNKKPGSKKRYAAMKRYFGYHKPAREILQKPCEIEFEGTKYISFCNTWSLAMTTEDCGEIELVEDVDRYPDVTRLLRFDGIKKKIDFRKVIAEATAKGYKLTNGEIGSKFRYLMHYDGTYYKLGLIDATYRIIDNGVPPITYHPDGIRMPLTIKNDIGLCMVMPVFIKDTDIVEDTHIVIEVE